MVKWLTLSLIYRDITLYFLKLSKKLHINTEKRGTFSSYQDFVFKQVPVGKVYEMGTVAIGKNTFANDLPAFTLEDEPYLRKLGVMGVLSGAVFRTSVLTIDMTTEENYDYHNPTVLLI